MKNEIEDFRFVQVSHMLTPIDVVGLSPGIYNRLRCAGVQYIGEVLMLGEDGLANIRYLGPKKLNSIIESLARYLEVQPVRLFKMQYPEVDFSGLKTELQQAALQLDREVEQANLREEPATPWAHQDRTRDGQDQDSLVPNLSDNVVNLVRLIIPVTKTALKHSREFEILSGRYGLEGSEQYTLQEMGDAYGVTRERVRQIESRAFKRIRERLMVAALESEISAGKTVHEAHELRSLIQARGPLVKEIDIVDLAEKRYEFKITREDSVHLRFLLRILGFQTLPACAPSCPVDLSSVWVVPDALKKPLLYQSVGAVCRELERSVEPMDLLKLRVEVNRRRTTKLPGDYIRMALGVCPTIEQVGSQELFQLKFEYLSSAADKAYRVLYEAEQPMTSRTILRQINHRLAKTGMPPDVRLPNLRRQLASDNRLEPIGRSGWWKIAKWKDRTTTILDLMQEFFHSRQTSATAAEVCAYVQHERPGVSSDSVSTYLSTDKFTKVSSTEYELAEWGNRARKVARKRRRMDLVEPAIREAFSQAGTNSMLLSQLVIELQSKTGLSKGRLYQLLRQPPLTEILIMEKDAENAHRKVVHYRGSDKPLMTELRAKTIRERIWDEVAEYLRTTPERRAPMVTVRDHVIAVTGCKRETFYSYVSRMESIAKESEDGVLYCYEITDEEEELFRDQVEEISDVALRENLRRAIRHLTVESIDLGLFELGKILEQELKSFLVAAKNRGVMDVTAKDLNRVVDMIDCIERNKVVIDKHHLTFLRQERNERAHGEIPDLATRKRLMQMAPFLAGLFVDYIVFFHRRRDLL